MHSTSRKNPHAQKREVSIQWTLPNFIHLKNSVKLQPSDCQFAISLTHKLAKRLCCGKKYDA